MAQSAPKRNVIVRFIVYLWRRSRYTRGCLLIVGALIALVGCSLLVVLGTAVGILPDTAATKTVEAQNKAATAAILALTPSDTPLPTDTLTATSTPTATFTPTITFTPSKTPIPSRTPRPTFTYTPTYPPQTRYVTANTVNVRLCAGTECEVVGQVEFGESLVVTGQKAAPDGEVWYSFNLDSQTAWIAGFLTSTERPVARPATQPPAEQPPPAVQATQPPVVQSTQPPVPEPANVCAQFSPSNCDEAVQTGLSASQIAACWPRLDRNHNGVACYGS